MTEFSLNLAENSISDEGASFVSKDIAKLDNLTELYLNLAYNSINSEGASFVS